MSGVGEVVGVLTAEQSRRLRRTLLRWLVVVVALVTVVSSAVNWVVVEREPQDPVDAWLTGIEEGRSRQLLSRDEAVRHDPTLDVFPNRVYRHAAGRVSGHEILGVRQDGERAEVRARVRWDGREEEHTYRVHRVERTGPFNDRWELDERDAAPLSVHLPAAVDELSVNGQSVPLRGDDRVPDPQGPGGAWRFEALPGEYAVGLPGNSYYAVAEPLAPRTVAFRAPRPLSVTVRLTPSPRMWQETEERIRAWLQACMAAAEPAPEGCPASRRYTAAGEPLAPDPAVSLPPGRAGAEITDVQWRLVSRPALVLVPDEGDPLRWHADPYRPAVAELSYREDGEQVVERIDFHVRATVRSAGSSAEITVGPGGFAG